MVHALQYGQKTIFHRDRMSDVKVKLALRGLHISPSPACCLMHYHELRFELRTILEDISGVAHLINSFPKDQRLDIHSFQEIVVSTTSRLLLFNALPDEIPESDAESVYHIGLILFMMTIFLQCDGRRLMRCDTVLLRLKAIFDRNLDRLNDSLLLWLALIGSIWVQGDVDEIWLTAMLKRSANRLQITNWSKAQSVVAEYPWIKDWHDQQGQIAWDLANTEST